VNTADVSQRGVIGTKEETQIKHERRRTMTSKPSKLALLLREINELGGKDASFLANVILCHHQRPMKKLKGLAKLLRAGRSVRTGQFSINVLVIDGQQATWKDLETA
jgi:hypothetical protein